MMPFLSVYTNYKRFFKNAGWIAVAILMTVVNPSGTRAGFNPVSPESPVKLIFIHHSTGSNWLADDNGQLGIALKTAGYYVSDTNYGWEGGGTDIGNRTDIGNWWEWFNGPDRDNIMSDLYAESGQQVSYSRMDTDPGGENEIVMFKSCFPNSALKGNPDDPPTTGNNPLRSKSSDSEYHTVGNAKGIYTDLLTYFAARQDKLFIVITAPPLLDGTYGANARAFNNWLVHDWLSSYPYHNVAVFDFFNVLTSNGGGSNTNDLGSAGGNHHRYNRTLQTVEHSVGVDQNTAAYPTDDDHPSAAGGQKASGEFIDLLNIAYHCWKGEGACMGDCLPRIQACEQDDQIEVSAGTPFSVTLSLYSGFRYGKMADWWVAAEMPWGWYFLTDSGWSQTVTPLLHFPLMDLPPVAIFSGEMPAGEYNFYFAVNTSSDFLLDVSFFIDSVHVLVKP